ncbi:hypothetical protein FQA39_LY18038 [Lamprigera yunnana]|nr:hypothetical protein FQA39_LY18038 [Lamprigera yunnana]
MSLDRIQKLLFSEYCDFEDMILVESPFAQTTREGRGIRQVHLGLTPTKLVLAADILPSVMEYETWYSCGIDPDLETFQLVAVYPVECLNLSVFHRRKRQSLKAHFCNNRILYFELGGFERRKMFWNLWCERIKFLNPEDPGSSHSETSVATSTSTSTMYLLSSRKVVGDDKVPQLWYTFGCEEGVWPKWPDRYLYLGKQLDEPPTNYKPCVKHPSYKEFLRTRQQKPLVNIVSSERCMVVGTVCSVNRFGAGVPEGCRSGLRLQSQTSFLSKVNSSLTQFNQIVKSAAIDYNNLIENSVRIWELSRDTNPYMYRRERHIRRYGISPLPHFLNGLGLWTVSQSETYSIQTKRAVSEVRFRSRPKEPEFCLSITENQLTSSISCETLHANHPILLRTTGIKTAVKKPIVFFWTPEYWYRPQTINQAYRELMQHLNKIRKFCEQHRFNEKKGAKQKFVELKRSNIKYEIGNIFNLVKNRTSNKGFTPSRQETSLQFLRRILRTNVALSAWDFDSTTLAHQLTIIDSKLFLKITSEELAILLWQGSSKNAPNVNAAQAFSYRVTCLITTELLRYDSDKIRARLISRLINAAEKCHKLSNFQSCKTILCGLQSLSVYRLHKTWMYVRKRHATKYQIFEILSRLYRDPRMPNYQKAFLKASETPPYLPYLGDLMLKLLHSNVCMYELIEKPKLSEENLKSIQKSRSLRTLQRVLIGMKLLSVDDVFEGGPPLNLYDEKLNILEKAVVFLENAQKSARAYNFQGNDLADEYLLKSRAKNLLVMEDTSVVQNGAQVGLQGGPATNVKQNEENNTKAQYSIPGILHFIQHEWARFELERSQWEVDRAELQARIAFLQGERKGQENLKSDLVRRIKMLEYALKQERAKFHKLKYGVELQQGDMKPPQLDEGNGEAPMDSEQSYTSVSKATWKQGYTDRIIDVQSNRVRTLLGLNNNADQEEATTEQVNGNESNKRASETQGRRTPAKKTQPSCLTEAMMFDTEAAVMANLDFLLTPDVDMEDDDDMSDDVELEATDELEDDVKAIKRRGDDVDAEAMEVLNELNLLSESENQHQEMKDTGDWKVLNFQSGAPGRRPLCLNDEENVDSGLGLGELAQLTVNNDAETSYDISSSKEAFRKTWSANTPYEVILTESHNGPVLCLAISGSGDHCYSGGLDGKIHCWNVPNSNIDPYDLFEPDVLSTTLQGHTDAVWGLSELQSEQQLLSCAADGAVKLWSPHSKIPLLNTFTSEQDGIPSSVDFVRDEGNRIVAAYNSSHCVIFDTETAKPLGCVSSDIITYNYAHEDRHIRFWDNNTGKMVHSMVAHLDAVTSLAVDPNGLYLLSGSHDCSIRLWHLDNKTCVQEITAHRKKFDESIFRCGISSDSAVYC